MFKNLCEAFLQELSQKQNTFENITSESHCKGRDADDYVNYGDGSYHTFILLLILRHHYTQYPLFYFYHNRYRQVTN